MRINIIKTHGKVNGDDHKYSLLGKVDDRHFMIRNITISTDGWTESKYDMVNNSMVYDD